MLYQDSLTVQTNLNDSGALPAPRHMAAQATDQTLSNAKTATTANNRKEVGVATTWDGDNMHVAAFYMHLKTALAARPDSVLLLVTTLLLCFRQVRAVAP